jgi:hypothetical protein
MNMRDFDVRMYQRADDYVGLEHKWQLADLEFLERVKRERPFLNKVRQGFRTLAQISKIRIQVTFEMRNPVLE